MISALRPSLAPPPRPAPAPAPAPTPAPPQHSDTVRLVGGTIASGLACAASGATFCGVGAGLAALAGIPFAGPGAIAAAVGISAVFGGTLSALTLRNSFQVPPGTEDTFKTGRGPITRNLPFPTRDGASMVLAEHAMWQSVDGAAKATSETEAAQVGAAGFERFGTILAHGGERTSSVVLGVALASSALGPALGVPLGIAGGFAASYVLDRPAHWLGSAVGSAIGAMAGRAAWRRGHA